MQQQFEHNLPTQDIVVRQDDGSDDEFFQLNIGQWYPLIRIKEQTIEFPNIVSFSLKCGFNHGLLPTCQLTIDDTEMVFRESNFINKYDVMTIWLGNPNDEEHRPIKNDYYIVETSSSPGSGFVSITAILYVPLLWQSHSRPFGNMTSLSVLTELAREVGLGVTTNITETSDQMTWLQSFNNLDMLHHVTKRSWISEGTYLKIFVDQFANLNIIDVGKLLNTNTETLLTTMPISGDPLLPPVPLYATNDVRGTEAPKAQIVSWAPVTDYGVKSTMFVDLVTAKGLNTVNNQQTDTTSAGSTKQLRKTTTHTGFTNDWIHSNYHLGRATCLNMQQLLQGRSIIATIEYLIPVFYLGMALPIEIFNLQKREERWSQDRTATNQDLDDVQPTGEPDMGGTFHRNEEWSGQTMLVDLSISYLRRSSKSTNTRHLQQTVTLFYKETEQQ